MQVQGIPEAYLDRGPTATGVLVMIAVTVVSLAVYLLPSIVGRRRRNANDIIKLNVLLGWTVIGWIVAMRRALKAH
jgi:hypothetical protein